MSLSPMLHHLTCVLLLCRLISGQVSIGILDADPVAVQTCQIALSDAFNNGDCPTSVSLVNGSGCLPGYASMSTAKAAQMYLLQKVSALVVDDCTEENAEIARLAKFWNTPVLLRSGNGLKMLDSSTYPYTVQFDDTTAYSVAQTLGQLMKSVSETKVLFIGPIMSNSRDPPILRGVSYYIKSTMPWINITAMLELDPGDWSAMKPSLDSIKSSTKMIVIDSDFEDPKDMLAKVDVVGLGKNLYMILLLCKNPTEVCLNGIENYVYDSALLMMAPSYSNLESINNTFSQKLGAIYQLKRFENYYLTYLACYGFCLGYKESGQPTGTGLIQRFYGTTKSFGQAFGTIQFDKMAQRLPSFVLSLVKDPSGRLQTAFTVTSTAMDSCNGIVPCFQLSLQQVDATLWTGKINMTLDPCVYTGGCVSYLPYIVAAGVLAMLIGLGAFLFFYRRQKRLDAYRMHWKIPRTAIKVIENKQSSVKGKGTSTEAATLSSKRRQIQAYALLDTTKAEFIAMKHTFHIRWSKEDLQFLMELKRVNHDNLTTFIGICYNDGDKFYILHNLIERASLEDYVFDSDFKLDETFKSAFLRDILKGLMYLHKSPIGYHGLLSLSSCLIDANWVLKLTDFGITNVLHRLILEGNLKVIENIPFDFYNNIAPEFLKDAQPGKSYPQGDQQGDIYSFGMILFQVLFRRGTFERAAYGHKELFIRIVTDDLRPEIDDFSPEEKPLIELMEQCWRPGPSDRPKIRTLAQIVGSAFQATKGNLVDQMIRMNEKHAQNLEQIVAERGAMLVEAQEQTDRLLCEILPPSIADKLKTGEVIEPRSYAAATVLFCQLVDFMVILTRTKPDQVVSFLNDVFTLFDKVISSHDAYKVETTGETYMVASGVPNENEDNHVFEISEIALEFREASYTYKVNSLQDWKLQVRIGYHCGPIAAGVIGLKAPRFCLFGDTVNFASRMQSNCPPNQIQMSESTALMLMPINEYKLTKRGMVNVKGKGSVNTYWLNEHIHENTHFPFTEHPPVAPPKSPHPKKRVTSPLKPVNGSRKASIRSNLSVSKSNSSENTSYPQSNE